MERTYASSLGAEISSMGVQVINIVEKTHQTSFDVKRCSMGFFLCKENFRWP
jgi:hypothetical protein